MADVIFCRCFMPFFPNFFPNFKFIFPILQYLLLLCIQRCAINPAFPPDYLNIKMLDITMLFAGFKHFLRTHFKAHFVKTSKNVKTSNEQMHTVKGPCFWFVRLQIVLPNCRNWKCDSFFPFHRSRHLHAQMPMKCSLNSNQPSASKYQIQ